MASETSAASDEPLSTGGNPNSVPCGHDWMQRGTEGDLWRECFLCGQQESTCGTRLWCEHHGIRSRCLPCFKSDVLALCRDHQGMSAHMLAEAIADLCGVDLRAEAREETEKREWPIRCLGCGCPQYHCLQTAAGCCATCEHRPPNPGMPTRHGAPRPEPQAALLDRLGHPWALQEAYDRWQQQSRRGR